MDDDQIVCPLECINRACPQPDFIERNGTWLLTLIGMWAACFGALLTYFLKSRCKRISCCGVSCDRDVLSLSAEDVRVTATTSK